MRTTERRDGTARLMILKDRRALACAAAIAMVLFAVPTWAIPQRVTTSFHNSIDIAGFRGCAWKEGQPASNYEVEQAIRLHVSERLMSKGYVFVDSSPDCWVVSVAEGDRQFDIGILTIEIYDRNQTLAWRGEVTGLIDPVPKKIKKLVKRTSKKMFKNYPKARSAAR